MDRAIYEKLVTFMDLLLFLVLYAAFVYDDPRMQICNIVVVLELGESS